MSKRLLYAEDEYTNRKIMEIQCRKAGVECVLAEDGKSALEFMESNLFDLVILDLYMPGINGDALVKEARSRGISIPLIAITSDDSKVEHLLSCGFDNVYIKPLRSSDYNKIISSYLS
jgi:CheY-like chemotaxis protein